MGEEECMGGEEVYGGIGSVCRECTLCGGRECVGVSVCGGVCVGGCVLGRRSVREGVREDVVGIRMRTSENYNTIF